MLFFYLYIYICLCVIVFFMYVCIYILFIDFDIIWYYGSFYYRYLGKLFCKLKNIEKKSVLLIV